jgi:uncharacterized protein
MPRRAVFHRYPFIGRFAAIARREEYLWSFRRSPVRRALYAGSLLAFQPLLGIQLLVGLLVAILARGNFMVIGILQFITNPFTAVPLYGMTFVVGRQSLTALGFELRGARLPVGWSEMNVGEIVRHIGLGTAFGHGVLCLVVGGLICGLALAATLDAVYYLGARSAVEPAVPPQKDDDGERRDEA